MKQFRQTLRSIANRPVTLPVLLLLLLSVVQSCDPNRIYESNVVLPDDGWHRAKCARFEVEITDTINSCNIFVNVRNNSKFKWMELWLFVDAYSPSGYMQRDTLKIMLADSYGKWLGHGLGDKYDNRILFHRNIRFPVSGLYIFEYEQAMRSESLVGIDDIGLRIELAKE